MPPLRGEAAPPPHETGELALLPCEAGSSRHRTHKAREDRTTARARLERVKPPTTLLVEEGQ